MFAVWEVLTEAEPYAGLAPVHVALHVSRGELQLDLSRVLPDTPAVLVDVVRAAQRFDPQERPTFAAIRAMLEK